MRVGSVGVGEGVGVAAIQTPYQAHTKTYNFISNSISTNYFMTRSLTLLDTNELNEMQYSFLFSYVLV